MIITPSPINVRLSPMVYAGLSKKPKMNEDPDIALIINTVSDYFGMENAQIMKKTNKREIVYPRQLAIYFLFLKKSLKLTKIGNIFGGMHHTSILYSLRLMKDLMEVDETVQRDFLKINALI